MASLLSSSTVYHNSLQQQFSALQSHSPLVPFTNERLNILASPSKRHSVLGKNRQSAANVFEVPHPDAGINFVIPEDREPENEELSSMMNLIEFKLQPLKHRRMSSSAGNTKGWRTVPLSTSPSTIMKRSSGTLHMIPSVQGQWKSIVEDVKELFGKGQYTKCSTRCRDILGSLTQPPQLNALHIVYLWFYNAIALDQTARSHYDSSTQKRPIFLESLDSFQKAASALQLAALTSSIKSERFTDPRPRLRHSSISSVSSSNRSSIDSVFSQASFYSVCSDASSRPPSPQEHDSVGRNRPRSLRDSKSARPRSQKRVSFAQIMPTIISHTELSFEGEEDEEAAIINAFPLPPPSPPLSAELQTQTQNQTQPQLQSRFPPATALHRPASSWDSITQPTSTAHAYSQYQHQHQYQEHLKSFSSQLEYHTRSIQIQLKLLNQQEPAVRSAAYDIAAEAEACNQEPPRRTDLHARIARLKAQGWPRRRFDASRYHALCETAITEMAGY